MIVTPPNLSLRGQVVAKAGEEQDALAILRDLWDPETNPNGYVSLGIAENVGIVSLSIRQPPNSTQSLMHDELQEFINSSVR